MNYLTRLQPNLGKSGKQIPDSESESKPGSDAEVDVEVETESTRVLEEENNAWRWVSNDNGHKKYVETKPATTTTTTTGLS